MTYKLIMLNTHLINLSKFKYKFKNKVIIKLDEKDTPLFRINNNGAKSKFQNLLGKPLGLNLI